MVAFDYRQAQEIRDALQRAGIAATKGLSADDADDTDKAESISDHLRHLRINLFRNEPRRTDAPCWLRCHKDRESLPRLRAFRQYWISLRKRN